MGYLNDLYLNSKVLTLAAVFPFIIKLARRLIVQPRAREAVRGSMMNKKLAAPKRKGVMGK